MRVFVDCDDTLVIWHEAKAGDHPLNNWTPSPNMDLVEALRLLNGLAEIIVWSGGGATYATTWAEKYLTANGVHYAAAGAKDRDIVDVGDIVVDDEEFSSPGILMTPARFIAHAKDVRAHWDASHAYADHGGGH